MTPAPPQTPPCLARALLRLCLPVADADAVLGDLAETYAYLRRAYGDRRARRWYWSQVLRSLPTFFLKSLYWTLVMLKNYLTIAARNLRKHLGYSFINVAGLGLGLACCLLILLYVQDELRYDRHHEHADRVYRMVMHGRLAGNDLHLATAPAPLADALRNDFPEVEATARFRDRGEFYVCRAAECFEEPALVYADSSVFDVFTLPLVRGEQQSALTAPSTVVLSATMAQKYFGTADPLGQTLLVDDDTYTVTGVMEDIPAQSHFHFDALLSMASLDESRDPVWFSLNFHTYALLAPEADLDAFEAKLPAFLRKYAGPQMQQAMGITFDKFEEAGNRFGFAAQPLAGIHLHSDLDEELEPNGNVAYVYIFSAVALFILLIACINFMNLATARSANRAKEVGVRKVLGSLRIQLVRQFLTESMLMSLLAFSIALGLVWLLLPAFNGLAAKQLSLNSFASVMLFAGLLGFVLVIGMLAGSYPALYLSAFQPASVLKGTFNLGVGRSTLRNVLVVFQFAISIVLLIGTGVVFSQLRFVQQKELGFDREHVLVVGRVDELGTQREAFKEALEQYPGSRSVSLTSNVPGRDWNGNGIVPEGAPPDQMSVLATINVDDDFARTMGLEVAEGRFFSPDFTTDSSAVLLNEAAVRQFGWEEPIGKKIYGGGDTPEEMPVFTVIGVVKDFHFESLHQAVRPMAVFSDTPPFMGGRIDEVVVRLASGDPAQAIAFIEETWNTFVPDKPFSFAFLDASLDALYRAEQRTGRIFTTFAVLALVIACLGLLGLASFATERRFKEIGIRKAMGATVPNIVVLLSREFTALVGFAFVLAAPVAYFGMQRWLEGFAYRVEMPWLLFALAGVLALAISFLTVSFQSIRAARANPVDALRYE